MAESAARADELLRSARYFEARGDLISAIAAYRDAMLSGSPSAAAPARRRLAELAAGRHLVQPPSGTA